ncbi:cyclopropane-fatty-acyl-phospholipid synthase [Actinokineospora alba]|uniref:Cyclopropane-fatty-acyl-phospholipid synthase n=1 Tax=Actinokineospora alba TaxID=504798 RepID=A0A1H0V088_9PSEU|nr:cyclopropane-fatty-acyl-phospholipid synthase family protein [Actinokineospora alba]TDP68952.1 cyclopropane-fatty-acyl-phospholipid synthase [Actinokineospora alba]SDI76002.1 cyclopropane-fatty-acyl-phospholipid synthase [Actinokineospora alba]SDP71754.1 cyclopropane-fatty-acyl-phospholipid synthase [Actinokineospora alba]
MTDTTLRSAQPWGTLYSPPRGPARARIARIVFANAVRTLPIRVLFPDGTRMGAGGPDAPVMRVHRPNAFFHRLGVDAKIGFGEGYMVGDWTSPDLVAVLTEFAARISTLIPPALQTLRRWVDRRQPAGADNTVAAARANIHRHYDLSNDLFAAFLDETMTYSSALFAPGDTDLHKGQVRKIDGMLDYAGVRAGSHVLEIGTGWGALAIQAARRGARVTTLTISGEQKVLAERRIAEAGLSERVQVLLRDYREAQGGYDAIVSVEMIEAVGQRYWPTYFATVDRLLKPGGRFGLQSITMPNDRMLASRDSYTWVQKYIFPGGLIPSTEAIDESVAAHTGLRVLAHRDFGLDYAETLRQWRARFTERWSDIADLGFDDTFRRMWEFYLAYSEAGFRSGYLGVRQLSIGH